VPWVATGLVTATTEQRSPRWRRVRRFHKVFLLAQERQVGVVNLRVGDRLGSERQLVDLVGRPAVVVQIGQGSRDYGSARKALGIRVRNGLCSAKAAPGRLRNGPGHVDVIQVQDRQTFPDAD